MKIKSVEIVYVCPICKNRRELHRLHVNLINIGDLYTGYKSCTICAAERITSILDIQRIECEVEG